MTGSLSLPNCRKSATLKRIKKDRKENMLDFQGAAIVTSANSEKRHLSISFMDIHMEKGIHALC